MKLRNKKTGEIAEASILNFELVVRYDDGRVEKYPLLFDYSKFEYYEDPNEYWYIDYDGGILRGVSDDSSAEKMMISMGNHFKSLEEAEKAVEKLKAWKRLKDNGVEIVNYGCYGRTNTKGEFSGEIKVTIDVPHEEDKYLFQLLFGGEE